MLLKPGLIMFMECLQSNVGDWFYLKDKKCLIDQKPQYKV